MPTLTPKFSSAVFRCNGGYATFPFIIGAFDGLDMPMASHKSWINLRSD